MKTTIENETKSVASVNEYPSVWRGSLGGLYLRYHESSGVCLHTGGGAYTPGEPCLDHGLWAGCTRLTTPITITFDPTK
jgi:hypothetical protein